MSEKLEVESDTWILSGAGWYLKSYRSVKNRPSRTQSVFLEYTFHSTMDIMEAKQYKSKKAAENTAKKLKELNLRVKLFDFVKTTSKGEL
jgi:hypothetical protein